MEEDKNKTTNKCPSQTETVEVGEISKIDLKNKKIWTLRTIYFHVMNRNKLCYLSMTEENGKW